MAGDSFYKQAKWVKLRNKVRQHWYANGLPCSYCGEAIDWSIKGGNIVDHIKNRKQYPHLAYELSNLCVVHHKCNTLKYYQDEASDKQRTNLSGFPEGSAWDSTFA